VTAAAETVSDASVVPGKRPSAWRRVWTSPLFRSKQAIAGLVIIALFVLTGLIGPLLLPYDPSTKVGPVFAHPGAARTCST
jgi:ABC-type antimicrobial peptide transport system permease subunit